MHHREAFCVGFFLTFFFKEMNTKCEQLNIEGKLKKMRFKHFSKKKYRRDKVMKILFMRQTLRL